MFVFSEILGYIIRLGGLYAGWYTGFLSNSDDVYFGYLKDYCLFKILSISIEFSVICGLVLSELFFTQKDSSVS